ncbi:MAG: hypothetical protein ACE14Q_05120 [Acidobacteriota bacterium]
MKSILPFFGSKKYYNSLVLARKDAELTHEKSIYNGFVDSRENLSEIGTKLNRIFEENKVAEIVADNSVKEEKKWEQTA